MRVNVIVKKRLFEIEVRRFSITRYGYKKSAHITAKKIVFRKGDNNIAKRATAAKRYARGDGQTRRSAGSETLVGESGRAMGFNSAKIAPGKFCHGIDVAG